MSIKQIEGIVAEAATYVRELTGRPLKVEGLNIIIDDEDISNDSDVVRMKAIATRPNKNYDWRDYASYITPKKLSSLLGNLIMIKSMGKAAVMKVNDSNTLQVNPHFVDEKYGLLFDLSSHELTHLSDFQNYSDRRFDLFEKKASLEEKLIEVKHKAGLVHGYLSPTAEIKEIESQMSQVDREIGAYMTLLESHASVIQEKSVDNKKLTPLDRVSWNLLKTALPTLPLLLLPPFKEKMKQYEQGQAMVKMAYEKGVDMGVLYSNLPIMEEFASPETYFERIVKK